MQFKAFKFLTIFKGKDPLFQIEKIWQFWEDGSANLTVASSGTGKFGFNHYRPPVIDWYSRPNTSY